MAQDAASARSGAAPRIAMVAGEASGDLLAALLLEMLPIGRMPWMPDFLAMVLVLIFLVNRI